MKIQYCIKIWPVFYGWLTYCSSPTDTSFFLHILISKVAHSLKDMPLSAEQWILGEILAKQLKRIWRWWSFGCLISTFFFIMLLTSIEIISHSVRTSSSLLPCLTWISENEYTFLKILMYLSISAAMPLAVVMKTIDQFDVFL